MKSVFIILFLFSGSLIFAQQPKTFKEVLNDAIDLETADSLLIDYPSLGKSFLDSTTGKTFVRKIFSNRGVSIKEYYSIAGKITTHKDFDVLLFCIRKSEHVSYSVMCSSPLSIHENQMDELFFILLDKNGSFINSFLAAANYEDCTEFKIYAERHKRSERKISSMIYRNFTIIQQTEIGMEPQSFVSFITSEERKEPKPIRFQMEYRINDYGVFVAYPKYKSN